MAELDTPVQGSDAEGWDVPLQRSLDHLDGPTDLGSTAEPELVVMFLCHIGHSVDIAPAILGVPLERPGGQEAHRAFFIAAQFSAGRIYEIFEHDAHIFKAGDHAHGVEGGHGMSGVSQEDGRVFVAESATFHRLERNVLMIDELLGYLLGGHEVGDYPWITIPEPGLNLLGVCFQVVRDFRGDDHTCSERAILISDQHDKVMREIRERSSETHEVRLCNNHAFLIRPHMETLRIQAVPTV